MILFLHIFLLEKFLFSVINNLGTPSLEMQIIFRMLQIDTENSATGIRTNNFLYQRNSVADKSYKKVLWFSNPRKENI